MRSIGRDMGAKKVALRKRFGYFGTLALGTPRAERVDEDKKR
jgi:hypothetical protein